MQRPSAAPESKARSQEQTLSSPCSASNPASAAYRFRECSFCRLRSGMPLTGSRIRCVARPGGERLTERLRLTVQKVVHHDDVVLPIIIRPCGDVARRNSYPGDAGVGKDDAQEGQPSIPRRGGDGADKEQIAVGVEVFDQRAGLAGCLLLAAPTAVGLVDIGEDRAEATHHCGLRPHGAGDEEQGFGDVAAYRGEQALRAEGAEDGAIGRIVEELGKAALGTARHGRLRKARSRCDELAAPGVEEHIERRYRDIRIEVRTAAVPVDLAATVRKRAGAVAIVRATQSGAKIVHRTLNRGGVRPGCLEHSRRNEVVLVVTVVLVGKRAAAGEKSDEHGCTNQRLHGFLLIWVRGKAARLRAAARRRERITLPIPLKRWGYRTLASPAGRTRRGERSGSSRL